MRASGYWIYAPRQLLAGLFLLNFLLRELIILGFGKQDGKLLYLLGIELFINKNEEVLLW